MTWGSPPAPRMRFNPVQPRSNRRAARGWLLVALFLGAPFAALASHGTEYAGLGLAIAAVLYLAMLVMLARFVIELVRGDL